MPAPKKRFIAGAVCPQCAQMDKIVMFKQGGGEFRECVACGFAEQLYIQPKPSEIPTRVNVSEADKIRQTQPIRIIEDTSGPKN